MTIIIIINARFTFLDKFINFFGECLGCQRFWDFVDEFDSRGVRNLTVGLFSHARFFGHGERKMYFEKTKTKQNSKLSTHSTAGQNGVLGYLLLLSRVYTSHVCLSIISSRVACSVCVPISILWCVNCVYQMCTSYHV